MSTFHQLDATKASRLLSQSDASTKAHHKDDWIDWEALLDYLTGDDESWRAPYLFMRGNTFKVSELVFGKYFVQRLDALAPCGWFSLSQVRRKLEAMHNGG